MADATEPMGEVDLKILGELAEGFVNARYLALASFVALLYDYGLTFSQEVEHFWPGRGGIIQSGLFFLNRYIPFVISPLVIIGFFGQDLPPEFCNNFVHTLAWVLSVQAFVAQGILMLRIYFMYTFLRPVQYLLLASYGINVALSATFLQLGLRDPTNISSLLAQLPPGATNIYGAGCQLAVSWNIWKMFATVFVFHVFLFVLTTARAFRGKRLPLDSEVHRSIQGRLIQDGGFWYIVILLAVGWTSISALRNSKDPQVSIPAMFAGFMSNMVSISVSRIILSIRSLAASLSFDPPWILNTSELGRLRVKRAAYGNDLLVDVGTDPARARAQNQSTGMHRELDSEEVVGFNTTSPRGLHDSETYEFSFSVEHVQSPLASSSTGQWHEQQYSGDGSSPMRISRVGDYDGSRLQFRLPTPEY